MNKNALYIVFTVTVLFMLFSFVGCAEKTEEKAEYDFSNSIMTSHSENQSEQSSEINAASQPKSEENLTDEKLSVEQIDEEETYPEAPGQLDVTYTDISQIINDAGYIVEVSIAGQSVEMLDGFPQTHTTVNIINVLKDDLNADDTLEVVEEGGVNGRVMGGIPQLSDGSDYLLFLKKYNDKYYICGAFQGRFIIREGYAFQQATEDVKLRTYSPAMLGDFKDMLSTEISKQEAQER